MAFYNPKTVTAIDTIIQNFRQFTLAELRERLLAASDVEDEKFLETLLEVSTPPKKKK